MADISKISPDDGSTILNIKDKNAVHWGDQSKGYVGKNLFKNTGLSTKSNNVVFTHNSDDSIGLNNTASATTFYTIGSVASLAGINQNVILSGCPTGGDVNNGYSMGIRTTSNKNVRHDNIDIVDTGNGFIFNPSNPLKDSDGNSVSISDLVLVMRIGNGVNVSSKTFYPMIRLASIPDSTYEPWYMSNRELTEVQKMTFLNDTTNSRFIKGYKVGRIVNICIKGSFPQNDTYPTLDTSIPLEWQPIESIAVANYSAGMQTGTGFVQLDNSLIRISNPANLPYFNTTLSYISKG